MLVLPRKYQPMTRWRAARRLVESNTRDARVLMLGDSLTAGYNISNTGSFGSNDVQKSFTAKLAAKFPNAAMAGFLADHNIGVMASIAAFDTRLAFTGTWTFTVGVTSVGGHFYGGTGAATIAFTPGVSFDSYDVFSNRHSGLGSFTTNIDSGATLATVAQAGTDLFVKTTVSGSGTTININWASGNCFVIGVLPHLSTRKQIDFLNAGWGSGKITDLAGSTNVTYGPLPAAKALAPDLTIICCTVNDGINGTASATYYANLVTLVTTMLNAGSDVVLMNGSATNTENFAEVTQKRNHTYAVARAFGLNMVDILGEWGGRYSSENTRGYIATDQVHWLEPANQSVADLLFPILLAA